MNVRRFTNEDAQAVSDLVIETLLTINIKDYSREYLDNIAAHHYPADMIRYANDRHFYVVEEDGRIIGSGAIGPYDGKEDESCLYTIFVHPDHQGRGIGKKIMQTLEQDEFFLRAKRVEVPASITGLSFYLNLGYRYKEGGEVLDEDLLYRLEKLRG